MKKLNYYKKNVVKFLSIVLSSTILFTSCSSATMISASNADNAKVYINGEYKGVTPYKQKDLRIAGSTINVTLKKDGYNDFNSMITKDEKVKIGAIVGGLFFLFPFIWTMGYDKTHKYEMSQENIFKTTTEKTGTTEN